MNFRPNFENPIDELTSSASSPEDDQQLEIGTPLDFIELQSPEYVAALGSLAIDRAQEWADVARMCRDYLVDIGVMEKSRRRPADIASTLPGLANLYETGDGTL